MQEEEGQISISVLPEGCITNIISFTSPRDACSLALVSSMFKSAAESDVVWEKFLPSDYQDLLSKAASPINLADFSSKKEVYQRLCGAPVLLEGGNTSLNLEKKSGKKIITLGSKALGIVWGDTPRYWTWTSDSDSRFTETAELLHVCWLEIHGRIDTRMLSPQTTYVAFLLIKNAERTHGLGYLPADATVGWAGTASEVRNIYLTRPLGYRPRAAISEDLLPHEREDGWMEVEIGEFYNEHGDGEVQMNVQEVRGGHWKRGLIVEGIELRPKVDST